MRRWRCFALCVLLAGLGLLAFSWIQNARALPTLHSPKQLESATARGPSLMSVYCNGCHANGRAKVDFDSDVDSAAMRRDRRTWTKVLHHLRSREMPPEGRPQPSVEDRELMIHWIEEGLGKD